MGVSGWVGLGMGRGEREVGGTSGGDVSDHDREHAEVEDVGVYVVT